MADATEIAPQNGTGGVMGRVQNNQPRLRRDGALHIIPIDVIVRETILYKYRDSAVEFDGRHVAVKGRAKTDLNLLKFQYLELKVSAFLRKILLTKTPYAQR